VKAPPPGIVVLVVLVVFSVVLALLAAAFAALLVVQAHDPFVAFGAFALIALGGLVLDSVRETVGLLLGR